MTIPAAPLAKKKTAPSVHIIVRGGSTFNETHFAAGFFLISVIRRELCGGMVGSTGGRPMLRGGTSQFFTRTPGQHGYKASYPILFSKWKDYVVRRGPTGGDEF